MGGCVSVFVVVAWMRWVVCTLCMLFVVCVALDVRNESSSLHAVRCLSVMYCIPYMRGVMCP